MKHTKSIFCIGAIALASFAVAAPKSYQVTLARTAQAGSVQLNPGDYKVKVEGANAIFTREGTNKSFTIPAKVETVDKKFPETMIETHASGAMDQLEAIQLGGTKMKLEFGQ
jgi:hypothetical protein